MRSLSALLLIGLVLIAAGASFLLWRAPGETVGEMVDRTLGHSKETPIVQNPAPAALGAAQDAAAKLAKRKRARAAVAPEPAKIEVQQVEPAPPPPPPKPAPAFPAAADIQVGLERARLLEVYGQPTLKTTVMDQDRLVETFVYLRPDRNTATTALLRDGRVISASTSIY